MPSPTNTLNDNLATLNNGSLATQVFLGIAGCVGLYLVFFQDWTPLRSVRLQSPITFVLPDQYTRDAAIAAPIEYGEGNGLRPHADTIRTSAAFDLTSFAKSQEIELQPEDLSLDQARQAYIRRYGAIAVAEMRQFGIPASITIAQGLLETRAGQSALATKNNNHFGMKCFSRNCKRGHCTNFTDDTHKDFFLKFQSAWASFRAHSKLLTSGRYASLKKLGTDYRAWAHGLKAAGYATDPNYANALIKLIRLYGLDRLDLKE